MNATENAADFDRYKAFVNELISHAQRAALKVWRAELTPSVQARLLGELRTAKPMPDADAMRALARHLDTSLFAELVRVIPALLRDVSDETIAAAPNGRSIVFALAAEAGGAAGRRLIAAGGIETGTNAVAWLFDSEIAHLLGDATKADGEPG